MRRSAIVVVAWCCATFAFAGSAWHPARAAADRVDTRVVPQSAVPAPTWRAPDFPSDWTSTMTFGELPLERIVMLEQRNAAASRVPLQVGLGRRADLEAAKALRVFKWRPLRLGGAVARMRVASPDAMGLRVGLRIDRLPQGAELRFAGSSDPERVVAVVEARDAERLKTTGGLYWTPATDGEAQLIEIFVPRSGDAGNVSLGVEQVSHLLADSLSSFKLTKIGESESCNVDVACRVGELGASFVSAKNAVAHMMFVVDGASYICTGTLLNDTVSTSNIPYFYSATHCIGSQAVANTLNTFWNYEATACSSGVSTTVTQLSGGAAMLYTDATTDALLLRLNDAAPPGASFAGWDASVIASGRDVTAIHHPSGDGRKVSLGRTTGSNDSRVEAGWLSGTTEGGSSGSGLFLPGSTSYHLVGGLWGGSASCASSGSLANSGNRDWYSRFDKVYPYIKAWLSPGGGGTSNVAPVANFSHAASGRTVTFTDASTDGDGTIASRQWQFGDGATSSQANPVRTYAADGTYDVTLTVTDDDGATHSVTRQVTVSASGGGSVLVSGGSVTGLSGAAGSSRYFTIAVPTGATNLVVATNGGSGDADLYVQRGTPPTTSSYLCRSYSETNTESCSFASPAAGTWHVLVHGYDSYSNVALSATYQAPQTPPTLSVADASVVEGDSGTRQLLFTVRLSRNATSQVLFDAVTVAGSATAGTDYTSVSLAHLSIPAGSRTRNVVVTVRGDTIAEGIEEFQLKVGNVRGATRADGLAIGSILDDDRAAQDITGDGKSDILWRHSHIRSQRIWPGAQRELQVAMAPLPGPGWLPVAVDDFDGDGSADVFVRNLTSGANLIWPGGDATRQIAVGRVDDPDWRVVGSGDFDGDGNADLLWRHATTGRNTIWRSARSGTQLAVTRITNLAWRVGGVGDFDGDGKADIFWLHPTLSNQVWRSGNYATRMVLAPAVNAYQSMAGVGDFDGDGLADLLWRDLRTGANQLWPAGRYASRRGLTTLADLRWKVAALGDYNGDGKSDILWRHSTTGTNTVWRSARSDSRQLVAAETASRWKVFGGAP